MENMNTGWVQEIAKREFAAICGDSFPNLSIEGDDNNDIAGKKRLLFEYTRKVLGKDTENFRQETGDCVSFGTKNANEYLQCAQICKGQNLKFRPLFPPFFYGTSRVLVGKGKLGRRAGSIGAWVQEAAKTYGEIPRDDPSVPKYSGRVADSWGYDGPPNQFLEIGKKSLIKSTALLKTANDAAVALYNGYPCIVCSNYGFNMKPDSDGFHTARGTWGHCAPSGTIISARVPLLIEDVKVGDIIYDGNGNLQKVTETFVHHHNGEIVHIKSVANLPLEFTPEHPILTYSQSQDRTIWKFAKDITTDDYLVAPAYLENGQYYNTVKDETIWHREYFLYRVTAKIFIAFDGPVYNLEVENTHTYIANGLVVHNCMAIVAFGHHKDAGLYFGILNSWGDVHGQLLDFDDQSPWPVGMLRVKAVTVDAMIRQEDSFAFSASDGFPGEAEVLNKEDFQLAS